MELCTGPSPFFAKAEALDQAKYSLHKAWQGTRYLHKARESKVL